MIHDRPIPFRFALALVLSIVCFVLPAWADFETAMDAYNRKDYATALREWQALAEQGEADAQDFLGTLHFKGWGVAQNYTAARQWWEKPPRREARVRRAISRCSTPTGWEDLRT